MIPLGAKGRFLIILGQISTIFGKFSKIYFQLFFPFLDLKKTGKREKRQKNKQENGKRRHPRYV